MCISPDELTTEQLEKEIAALYQWADDPKNNTRRAWYLRRAELLKNLLKSKVEVGVIQ